jgi:DNA-binding transcriptional LysR family regulator
VDSLSGFQVFVQVAEARGFVAAGRQLGLSASAVGKRIARLEETLGVRLFHRSTRSVALTPEGVLFLERSRRILAEMEAAQQELSEAAAAPRGRLRVSLPVVSALMLPVLSDFMASYPAIELDLSFTDRKVDVIDEGFDAVVRTGEPSDSRLSARKVGSYRYGLYASPAYLQKHGTPQVPDDLMHHRCLHYRFPSSGKLEMWPIRRAEGEAEWDVPTSMICDSVETRVWFALQGLGIAFLPDFSIKAPLAQGQLCPVLGGDVMRIGAFYVLWPASKHPSPKVRALVDFLSERLFPVVAAGSDAQSVRGRRLPSARRE